MSRRLEIILINLICFGPFAVRSILDLQKRNEIVLFDQKRALFILGIEVVCGTIAVLILRARGWKAIDLFGRRPTMPQTIAGAALIIPTVIFISGLNAAVEALTNTHPDAATTFRAQLTWPVLIVLTLINPLYDELFAVAYNLRALEGSGAAFAITLSATIRFICHLDQGPIAAVTILPLGLIFGFIYWRWRVLWPLVVAHGMMDFMGLAPQ
jgi:membrane protease YdiL (CAAX protease family)